MNDLLTTEQAAEILGVTPSCMRQWRVANEGPAYYKVGRLARYRRDDLEAWLEGVKIEGKGGPQ